MKKIKPVFVEKIWGGTNLEKIGFKTPSKKTGEAWLISAHESNPSIINGGETLRDFYENNKELFNNYPSKEFPLLVKILDATDDLSIQVHPDDNNAMKLENYPFGKTECWYVLDANKNQEIIIGVNSSSKEEAKKLIDASKWNDFLKYEKIKPGDFFDIEAGTVHAIMGGTLIYELQQSSDITYRLYDYDRKDDNGNLRDLDIEKSLKVINYEQKNHKGEPKLINKEKDNKIYSLINNKLFAMEKWDIKKSFNISFDKKDKNFLLITLIEGSLNINNINFSKYESAIIFSNELNDIQIKGNGTLLVSNPK